MKFFDHEISSLCYTLLALRPARTSLALRQFRAKYCGLVYKIPYRSARAWPSARASKGILHTNCGRAKSLYTLISRFFY